MPESSVEMFARVRLMAHPDTDWDLSAKDTAALRHVLAAAEAREAGEVNIVERINAAVQSVQPTPNQPTSYKLPEVSSGGVHMSGNTTDAPTAAVKQALEKAHWIGCSPHEWPTAEDIPLLCSALIAEHERAANAADVIAACEKALKRDQRGLSNILDCRRFEFGDEFRYGALTKEEVTDEIDRIGEALSIISRWKEANGGNQI